MNIEVDKPWLMMGDSAECLKKIPDGAVDLTVTSPPYDNLRTYRGYSFDFETIATELFRVTNDGGVVVWIVGDATMDGGETLSSFRQAIYFKDVCGFNVHDTMIWNKCGFNAVGALSVRYAPVFEYMFILVKGKIRKFNPLKDRKNKYAGGKLHGTIRKADGTSKSVSNPGRLIGEYGQRFNVWELPPERRKASCDHPAPFPEQLAADHIASWSNPNDTVLDPFLGSGTTGKMAVLAGRKFIGIELSERYLNGIARYRIEQAIETVGNLRTCASLPIGRNQDIQECESDAR